MKKFYFTLAGFLLVILAGIAYSQDKPEAKPEDPAKIELSVEDTKKLNDAQKDAQITALQVENLTLKIQQAQEDLKKLQDAQKEKQAGLSRLITSLTKLPVEKLQNYTIEEKDGKLVLTKK